MQGYNKYYPPDYDGKKNLNQLSGTHALGKRARKLDKGILITRFELPFSIWCGKCNKLIAQGVRFNAEKKKVGNYYTTPIWSFKFKCHECSNWIDIHTDPQNTAYKVVSGARQKVDEFDGSEIGAIPIDGDKSEKTSENNAFVKFEHENEESRKRKAADERISQLYAHQEKFWNDPYTQSQRVRRYFRRERKELESSQAEKEALASKAGLSIPICDKAPSDDIKAAQIDFGTTQAHMDAERRVRSAETGRFFSKRNKAHTKTNNQNEQIGIKREGGTDGRSSLRDNLKPQSKRRSKPSPQQSIASNLRLNQYRKAGHPFSTGKANKVASSLLPKVQGVRTRDSSRGFPFNEVPRSEHNPPTQNLLVSYDDDDDDDGDDS